MELISKKTEKVLVRRTQKQDFEKIYDFHKNTGILSRPAYLQNVLENSSGISILAYKDKAILGHILIVPFSSRHDMKIKEAAAICGVWAINIGITEMLGREAMMCAWEEGYHVLFALENHAGLKKVGFEEVDKNYFAINLRKYDITGIELSWDGFDKIQADLVLPKTFLPSDGKFTDFSTN